MHGPVLNDEGMRCACGQSQLANRLRHPHDLELNMSSGPDGMPPEPSRSTLCQIQTRWYQGMELLLTWLHISSLRPNVPAMPEFHYFEQLGRQIGRMALTRTLRARIHAARGASKAPHWHRFQSKQTHAISEEVKKLLRSQHCSILICAGSSDRVEDAIPTLPKNGIISRIDKYLGYHRFNLKNVLQCSCIFLSVLKTLKFPHAE